MINVIAGTVVDFFRALYRNRAPIFYSGCCGLLLVLFLIFFYAPPGPVMGPEQPIPFSHRLHVSIKNIQCKFCHPYVERSVHPGIPPTGKCLYCHKYIIANHLEIKKIHKYYNERKPIPWRQVNYLAEHVFFNHQRHIKKGLECKECHGAVETQDRLNGVAFEMGFCVNCHRERGANLDCWRSCHN